jgi:2,4-dienoyl-CoA reductase-like NADH-dependent reductase (Old Yellow Enzyme family)
MPSLFEKTTVKSISLKNRFMRSATWEGLADEEGKTTPDLVNLMEELVRGGVGLIISSHAFVRSDGKAGPWQLGVNTDDHTAGLKAMADAVHRENGKIFLQLAHAGCQAATNLTGLPAVGPSPNTHSETPCEQLSVKDIHTLSADFASAARRAKEAHFDGVQIHAAHGYLLSQFLSPHYNRRTDSYGGSHAGRALALLETVEAVRREVGEDFPVFVKINADDTLDDGVLPQDMVKTALLLERAGIDAIEISGGCRDGRHPPARKIKIPPPDKEAYYEEAAMLYKQKVKIPLILVGGIRSFETAERLVDAGFADYVAMSRPLVCEPNLVNRWQKGDRRPSKCISENLCYTPIRAGEGIRCVIQTQKNAME